jgi:uncharacterized membrane protein
MRQAFRWGALAAVAIGYSVLEYRAAIARTPDLFGAVVAMLPFALFALAMAWRSARPAFFVGAWLAGCALLYVASDWLVAHYQWVFLIQHAGIHALLFVTFGRSLRAGRTPLVTGFARLVHSTMTPALDSYTRAVTWAWTIYFGSMASLSLLLFWLAPVAVWSAFATLLGIPLLALMFIGEYAVRCIVLPPSDRAGPIEAIRAYRRSSSGGPARLP